jgi:CHAT domain-containing protein
MLITKTGAKAAKLRASPRDLDISVGKIRHSIVYFDDDGVPATEPFDLVEARKLYEILFGPFDTPLDGVTNLIFEPDGALLQLPPNLLVTDQASVTAYTARSRRADPYDFTGVKWLGRDRDVTTAVSPRSFVDVRQIPPARGEYAYLGLGENAVPDRIASFLSVSAPPPADNCAWPPEVWEKPISPAELFLASSIVGRDKSQVITGAAFSDTAILQRTDLTRYRVIHFATHGLVTAPRPECPARPALLTSFGPGDSDGLLTFKEIYDLRLDADVVVLSACDTAGAATIEATREAGITSGGNFALDGLVRAFVGAGARTVVASHWPVPDDFNATQRLILGLFNAPRGTAVSAALRRTQRELMDQAATSHPYYWSAFAVVGDGERAMLSAQ